MVIKKEDISKLPPWKQKLYIIIFEAETPKGKLFDVVLLIAILASVLAILLESVADIQNSIGSTLKLIEWTFTFLFSIEFIFRIICSPNPLKYMFSFFGLVDLLSILPSYIGLILPGMESMLVIRALRLLRVFRILKLARFLSEAEVLIKALKSSRPKILIFLGTIFIIVIIMGSIMYLIEGAENGFTSIPRSIYWAIVTMTTVGYGDIAPKTVLGQTVASFVMIMGYAIIAVPTGIVSAEISQASRDDKIHQHLANRTCSSCTLDGHEVDAKFCRACGHEFKNKI